ncbi:putative uncharacterized protein [Acidaminococcus sp. CAG:917]|nr:putative uncharacterized protein [Acidaminococcus sp. CAG:917]
MAVYPRISFIAEYSVNRVRYKRFALMQQTFAVQFCDDVFHIYADRIPLKDVPYYVGFFGDYHGFLVFVLVSVRYLAARQIAFPAAFVIAAPYLLREFRAVIFRISFQHTFKDDAFGRVGHKLCRRYDFNAVVFQGFLVYRRFVLVPRESVEFVNEYIAESPLRAVPDHALEIGTVVVRPRHCSVNVGV